MNDPQIEVVFGAAASEMKMIIEIIKSFLGDCEADEQVLLQQFIEAMEVAIKGALNE